MEVTVEDDGYLDFSSFDVAKHSGVLLDGLGDILLLKKHREVGQTCMPYFAAVDRFTEEA